MLVPLISTVTPGREAYFFIRDGSRIFFDLFLLLKFGFANDDHLVENGIGVPAILLQASVENGSHVGIFHVHGD